MLPCDSIAENGRAERSWGIPYCGGSGARGNETQYGMITMSRAFSLFPKSNRCRRSHDDSSWVQQGITYRGTRQGISEGRITYGGVAGCVNQLMQEYTEYLVHNKSSVMNVSMKIEIPFLLKPLAAA